MKKRFLYIVLFAFSLSYAQKMAYVDTQLILKQMPQYQQSEQRLNNEVEKWQKEITNQQSKLEKLRISFENEKVLLTEDQQKTKLSVIDSTEKTLNNFIEKKFGTKGESTSLRYNLIKPLQDQIWNAINSIAARDKYNIVFDKSSDLLMIFTDSKYDITDRVLKQLGAGGKDEKNTSKSNTKTPIISIDSRTSDREEERDSEDSETTKKDTKKPKTGYGSKYVPKKKQTNKAEVKGEETIETKTLDDAEVTEPKTTDTKPKTGYGSKYVPKKKVKETEVKKEEIIETKAIETKSKTEDSKSIPKEDIKKTEIKEEIITETKTADTTKPKTGYGSKYVPKKEVEKTEVEEISTGTEPKTTDTKPKTGYGSKYVPKKKQADKTEVKEETINKQ